MTPTGCDEICEALQADQIIVVCKDIEAVGIESFLNQIGYRNRIRDIILESKLCDWYTLACGPKYSSTLGQNILVAIHREMAVEFPLSRKSAIDFFFAERKYDVQSLQYPWL